jgi:hypothetical protein
MKLHQTIQANQISRRPRLRRNESERGAALIISLLLLGLMAALSLVMFFTVYSGSMINGYYRNYRGSFYAADSGANIAVQYLTNQVVASEPSTYSPGVQPIPSTVSAAAASALLTAYGANTSIDTGNASNSWNEKFYVVNSPATATLPASPSLSLAPGYPQGSNPTSGGTCTSANTSGCQDWKYVYNYALIVAGSSQGTEQSKIELTGEITINTSLAPSGPVTTSFAAWGMFIDQYTVCSGSDLVPGTISGPVFTNGGWTFGTSGQYIFTDTVGSADSKAGYDFGSCYQSTGGNYKSGGQTIAPQFQAGYQWGQPALPMPSNSYNQEDAVLNGVGTQTTAVTNSQLNATVKNISGTPYPTGGTSSGVYLPYSASSSSCPSGLSAPCFTGGGIYVQGNAGVVLTASTDSAGNPTEVYTITQGATTTKVTVDNTTNTTTMTSGGTNTVINGVPQEDPGTSSETDGTMLYVNGTITSLTGPSSGAAIANGTALTVTAASDVDITGNITYQQEPVTLTATGSTPADTLIPANNQGQMLGIFTANGNVNLDLKNSGNLEVDASIAEISQGGSGGLVNTGAAINTLTIVGGRIQNTIQNINSTTRNVFFDRRYANGMAPPFFPSTQVSPPTTNVATFNPPTINRVQWVDLSNR